MKLNYWVAICTSDSIAYSIRARTKAEVIRILENVPHWHEHFDSPKKHTIEYTNAFDLANKCLSESRGFE